MKVFKFYLILFVSIISFVHVNYAQSTDTIKNAWGLDVLISSGGFGLGTFYRHQYTDEISGFVSLSCSEAADDQEEQYINPYDYTTYVPGKINRFLVIPLYAGIQYRLFKDDIMDNFRPYLSAAAGPTMLYVFPYDNDFFSALRYGSPKYTAGGYVGFGAFIGSERSSLLGLNLRYYVIPYSHGIQSMWDKQKRQFGGFYISLSFGSAW